MFAFKWGCMFLFSLVLFKNIPIPLSSKHNAGSSFEVNCLREPICCDRVKACFNYTSNKFHIDTSIKSPSISVKTFLAFFFSCRFLHSQFLIVLLRFCAIPGVETCLSNARTLRFQCWCIGGNRVWRSEETKPPLEYVPSWAPVSLSFVFPRAKRSLSSGVHRRRSSGWTDTSEISHRCFTSEVAAHGVCWLFFFFVTRPDTKSVSMFF